MQDLDPHTRWSPRQALQHPFITNQPFRGPFQPSPDPHIPIRTPTFQPGSAPAASAFGAAASPLSPEAHAQVQYLLPVQDFRPLLQFRRDQDKVALNTRRAECCQCVSECCQCVSVAWTAARADCTSIDFPVSLQSEKYHQSFLMDQHSFMPVCEDTRP